MKRTRTVFGSAEWSRLFSWVACGSGAGATPESVPLFPTSAGPDRPWNTGTQEPLLFPPFLQVIVSI